MKIKQNTREYAWKLWIDLLGCKHGLMWMVEHSKYIYIYISTD